MIIELGIAMTLTFVVYYMIQGKTKLHTAIRFIISLVSFFVFLAAIVYIEFLLFGNL
jgi:hypothetical protein